MHTNDLTIRSSAALTGAASTSYSDAVAVARYDELLIFLRVTAQGTYTDETLDLTVQTKDPDGNWSDLTNATFTQVGDVTGSVPYAEYIGILVFGTQIRIKYVTAGTTPNYTFSIKAIAKGS